MSRLSIETPGHVHRQIKAQASLRGLGLREYVLRRLNNHPPFDRGEFQSRFSDSGLSGMWADREDLRDPESWLREQRRGRSFADAD